MEGISRLQNTARYIKMKERGIKQNEEEKNCNIVSALMLYTNISYVGIDGNAEEILLEEPETLLNEST